MRIRYPLFTLLAFIFIYAGATLERMAPSASLLEAPIATTSAATSSPAASFDYRVVKVVDGDTVDVEKDGATTRIRLIGLDTPEVVDPRKPVQCFGREASDEAKKVLTGQKVRLEFDPSQGMFDKYGRTLAYLYVPLNVRPEGLLFNEYMIANGFGHEYTYRLPYKYQAEFKAAEVSARQAKKGFWADGVCMK